jgi:hypothetical protein
MGCFSRLSGWKLTAVYLTILVITLTTLLIITLFVSLFALERHDESTAGERTAGDRTAGDRTAGDALGQSILYKGNCDISSKANLWIHLLINIISTGVLASSNFFMQGLVAPTRAEVNAAHQAGHWLEIGVQSLKNFRFLGWRKILFWILFSLSSVPLHLIFNGCVLESKGSNGFMALVGSEELLHGGWKGLPSITSATYDQPDLSSTILAELDPSHNMKQMKPVIDSLEERNVTDNWEELPFGKCMDRYNKPDKPLTHSRHVVLIAYDFDDLSRNSTKGWRRADVLKNTSNITNLNTWNPLLTVDTFWRTGRSLGQFDNAVGDHGYMSNPDPASIGLGYDLSFTINGSWVMDSSYNVFDAVSGVIVLDPGVFNSKHRVLLVDRCYSEKYKAPCRLSIANSLLLVVCIMCLFKCILCILVLKLRVWGNENPLMTPGDAIASFISRPDDETRGMCTLSLADLKKTPKRTQFGLRGAAPQYKWLQGPRQWQGLQERKFGNAVPTTIWVQSSLLIGSALVVAMVMLGIAIVNQPL